MTTNKVYMRKKGKKWQGCDDHGRGHFSDSDRNTFFKTLPGQEAQDKNLAIQFAININATFFCFLFNAGHKVYFHDSMTMLYL